MNPSLLPMGIPWVAEQLLAWLWLALSYGTLWAGVTWLLAWTLRKRLSVTVHTLLGCLVLVKFMMPLALPGSPNLIPFAGNDSRRAAVESMPLNCVDAAVVRTAESALVGSVASPIQAAGQGMTTSLEPPILDTSAKVTSDWHVALAAAYVAALLAFATVRVSRYRRFHARCMALPRAEATTCALVADVCRRLGVRTIPATSISDAPPAPFVMGFLRPVLVLTRRQLARPNELETVIVHEVAHLRRGDLLVRLLQRIVGTLLFFWPVVVWVNRWIDRAREHACDEWALRYGKLSAPQYARCLLRATRPPGGGLRSGAPVCMAANPSTIERRINVILDSATCPSGRTSRAFPLLAVLLACSAFAMIGATSTGMQSGDGERAATQEAVQTRAAQVYARVADRAAADINGEGFVSYREKSAYLIGLAMGSSVPFMDEFPFADRNNSGTLDLTEAYDAIRGITLVAYADRRPTAEDEPALDFEFYHVALDAQEWLLDRGVLVLDAVGLEDIRTVLCQLDENPRAHHKRMLNHGAPERPSITKGHRCTGPRYSELEGNIAAIEAKLAQATSPKAIAVLESKLAKLRTILDKLGG